MSRRAGFSLLEVLMSMVILTVGAASLLALFASAAATHKRSVDRTEASLVAEELISEVQARYLPGTELDELETELKSELPERIRGYLWSVVLLRPGEAESKGPRRAGGKTESKTTGKNAASRSTPSRPSPAPAAGSGGTKKKSTLRRLLDGVTSALSPSEGEWLEDELLVRVTVRWSERGGSVAQTYDTLLLPRAVTEEPAGRR